MKNKEKFFYVCLNCHKTSDYENKDGECKECEKKNKEE
jgi:DNA-directed RNA polymerase subunit RPC12/RpoP